MRRAVTAWRLRHPELRQPIALAGLLAVCARERILVRPTRGRWCLGELLDFQPFGFGDERIIMLNDLLDGPARLRVLLHELGHAAMHSRDRELRERYGAEMKALSFWYERDGTSYLHRGEGPVWRMVEAEADAFADALLGSELAEVARRQLEALEHVA